VSAGGDAQGVGVEDDLEQDRWIKGRSTGLVIAIAGLEDREIHLVIDDVIEGIFEGAGENLLREGNGEKHSLLVGVVFVTSHVFSLSSGGLALFIPREEEGCIPSYHHYGGFSYSFNVQVQPSFPGRRDEGSPLNA
jgi:hypothetical protein